jgi:hypothetical protein
MPSAKHTLRTWAFAAIRSLGIQIKYADMHHTADVDGNHRDRFIDPRLFAEPRLLPEP